MQGGWEPGDPHAKQRAALHKAERAQHAPPQLAGLPEVLGRRESAATSRKRKEWSLDSARAGLTDRAVSIIVNIIFLSRINRTHARHGQVNEGEDAGDDMLLYFMNSGPGCRRCASVPRRAGRLRVRCCEKGI